MSFEKYNKRIIIVSNTSWYLYNFRLPLLKELVKRGNQVFALAPFDSYAQRFKDYGIKHVDIQITRSGINPVEDIALVLKFLSIYKRHKPDIVQHFTVKPVIYGTIAARISRVRDIYNMVSGLGYVFTGTSFKKFWVQKIVRFLYRRTMLFSQHVFFQNQDDRTYFLEHNMVDKQKTSVIPGTGVDTAKFSPRKHERKNAVTFILAARMLWDKGIKEYVDAAYTLRKKYNNIDFWLLGPVDRENPKGISSEQLEKWNKQGTVKYFGMTDNIKSYLEKADVIVLPSYYREGLPLSLLEGAAMGMPIITADSTGCREVVEDGINGYLVPIKDPTKLASAMEKFIVNPDLISRMGKASRRMAIQRFDSKKVVKEILKYYPF